MEVAKEGLSLSISVKPLPVKKETSPVVSELFPEVSLDFRAGGRLSF